MNTNSLKKFVKKWKKQIFFGSLIIVLAALLRIVNLNALPVFGDEAIYIRWAQVMWKEPPLRFVPLSDGKQPLFMWLIIPFLKVINDPLIAGRLVSVLAGLGTLLGVFVLSYRLTKSEKICLAAGLAYTVSPFSVFFDRIALADSLLAFFGIWSVILATETAKYLRFDTALLTGFALGGALLTKSPAIFFLILIPIVYVFKIFDSNKKMLGESIYLMFLLMVSYVVGYGFYNILRLGPQFHMIALRNKDYVYPLRHFFESPFNPFMQNLKNIFDYFVYLLPVELIVSLVLGFYVGIKRFKNKTLPVVGVFAILPILVVAEFSKTMTARYIYFSMPYIFILSAFSLLVKKSALLKLAKVIFLLFIIHALYIDAKLLVDPARVTLPRTERSGYLEEWTAGYGIKDVAEHLKELASVLPDDQKITVGTEGYFGTLPDGLQIYLNSTNIEVFGVGQPIRGVPDSLVEFKKEGNRIFLVVNSTRFKGDIEKLPVELLAVYPKAVQPDGKRESLLFFEVLDKDSL